MRVFLGGYITVKESRYSRTHSMTPAAAGSLVIGGYEVRWAS
jgi:hypothetical protein